jgi:hypothetical protein
LFVPSVAACIRALYRRGIQVFYVQENIESECRTGM